MKFAISFFTALLIAAGALLFMQYQVYSDQDVPTKDAYTYSQEIEITYRGGKLDIRHHFKNLPDDQVEIIWPATAIDRQCFLESETSCSRLSEDKKVFKAGEKQAQSISYVIPVEGGLTSPKLLKNIFTLLQNGAVGFSTVHISTDSATKGQWVTAVPMIGQQSLSLVNYTMFSGKGVVKDLFWQTGGVVLQKKTDGVSVYTRKGLSAEVSAAIDDVARISDEHIAIIEGTSTLEGHRMLFLPTLTVETVQKQVIMAQMEQQYDFGNSPLWIKHIVAMTISGETYGTPRALQVAETLNQLLDEEMKTDWKERIAQLKGQEISAQVLDEQLTEVLGTYTEYFSMNVDTEETYPFVVNDHRSVYVNGQLADNIDVLLHEGKILYTADTLLQRLGYTTSIGENGYYVNSPTRVFRFPDNKHGFYVFNQRRYNIATSFPLHIVGGDYYIEETWMQRLFLIELLKDDETIQMTTTAQQ